MCLLEDWDTDSSTEPASPVALSKKGDEPKTPKTPTTPTVKQKSKKERVKEASALMTKVPGLRQKIAGKSIPLEVCIFVVHLFMTDQSFALISLLIS